MPDVGSSAPGRAMQSKGNSTSGFFPGSSAVCSSACGFPDGSWNLTRAMPSVGHVFSTTPDFPM